MIILIIIGKIFLDGKHQIDHDLSTSRNDSVSGFHFKNNKIRGLTRSDFGFENNGNVQIAVVSDGDGTPSGESNDGIVDVDGADGVFALVLLHGDLIRRVDANGRDEDAGVGGETGDVDVVEIHSAAAFAAGCAVVLFGFGRNEGAFESEENLILDGGSELVLPGSVSDGEGGFLVLVEVEITGFDGEGRHAGLDAEREVGAGTSVLDGDFLGDGVAEKTGWKFEGGSSDL